MISKEDIQTLVSAMAVNGFNVPVVIAEAALYAVEEQRFSKRRTIGKSYNYGQLKDVARDEPENYSTP